MSAKRKKVGWFRSVAAVLGGYMVAVALTLVMDRAILLVPDAFDVEEQRYLGPWPVIIVALGFLSAVIAGFVTAAIARGSEIPHALALMGLFLVMWILFVIKAPPEQSTGYQTGLQLGGVCGALVGGVIRAVQVSRKS